jgi:putative transposase
LGGVFKRRSRLKTFPYLGFYRYFLTFCTADRRCVFVEAVAVDRAWLQFLRYSAEEQFDIIVACFMPDHVHLLVEGRCEASDLRRFVRLSKQGAGFAHRQATAQWLWQPSFFDHVLRDDESTLAVARYILENPLRAGLVTLVTEYPFYRSSVYTTRELIDSVCYGRQA